MSERARARIVVVTLLLFSAAVFLCGITWGLPTRAVDPYLFGSHEVWSGQTIADLAGGRAANAALGADVDINPIAQRTSPIVLNQTDRQRAEIVRRYRLYTAQPDEMITMMALASMSPARRDFDPKLYQYGGMWIYPVGALIKVFASPRVDQVYYLDHPEEFARFYIVARLYVVAFAIAGAWAVFWIARRISGDLIVASAATLCYALMPVVVNMAHEAKPHLPGAVLILLTIIAATKYVETGLKRWWVLAGALCGAAAGMVLSAMLGLLILPVMALVRKDTWGQRIVVAVAASVIALDVYAISNPYVLKHLLGDRTVLLSNLQNSRAMYQAPASARGMLNAVRLIIEGTSPVVGFAGAVTALLLIRRRNAIGCILGGVSAVVLIQFFALATDKPGEYARFALLPDIAMAIAAAIGVAKLSKRAVLRVPLLAILVISTGFFGAAYVWHFIRDAQPMSSRLIAAKRLSEKASEGARRLEISAEPAPYSMPPVDLFTWQITLLPRGQFVSSDADVALRMVDSIPRHPSTIADIDGVRFSHGYWFRPRLEIRTGETVWYSVGTPISWSSKPIEVFIRQDLSSQGARGRGE
jgi:hypothetical protein